MPAQFTHAVGRPLWIRDGTRDQQTWSDAFVGLYHVPPEDIRPCRVLDVGANVGYTAAHYKAMWPRALVVAVEMDAGNVEAGMLNCPEAAWFRAAVAGWRGTGFYDPSGPSDALRLGAGGPEQVEVVTLVDAARWVQELGGGPPDLVKLDVEGSEWEILAEAAEWAPLVPRLLVELHGHGAPARLSPPLEGRDGPSRLVGTAARMLEAAGYHAVPHAVHPHAVYATRIGA